MTTGYAVVETSSETDDKVQLFSGQVLGGVTSDIPAAFTLQGTTGMSVALGAGTLTVTPPQDLRTSASPSFTGATISGVASGMVTSASGVIGSTTSPTVTGLTVSGVATGLVTSASGVIGSTSTPSVTSITIGGGTSLTTYVSGTWTPVLSFGGSSTGITYTTQLGTYTKIGNRVFVQADIVLSSKGAQTGSAVIAGLPVAVATLNANFALTYSNVVIQNGLTTFFSGISGVATPTTSAVGLFMCDPRASLLTGAPLTNVAMGNTSGLWFTGSYTC